MEPTKLCLWTECSPAFASVKTKKVEAVKENMQARGEGRCTGFAPCYRQTIRLPLQEWGKANQARSQSNLAGVERDICIQPGKPGEQVTGSIIQGRHRTDSPETHRVWLPTGALRATGSAWGGLGWGVSASFQGTWCPTERPEPPTLNLETVQPRPSGL